METTELIQEAQATLRKLEAELLEMEYLATASIPWMRGSRKQLREHAEKLASGLMALEQHSR